MNETDAKTSCLRRRPRLSLPDRLALRPVEVAEVLGISERTVRQLLPELPHVRVGSAVLVPVEALRGWLLERAKAEQGKVDAAVDEILTSISGD